ncbi:MAG: CoA ester lyase [Alphaproteobacteria bacterium]|nr:CoA ester lyase [Alphaproteobacteria bacterium]
MQNSAPARLNRTELAVPATRPELFAKAARSAADVVFLDLEDAVAPADKAKARKNAVEALNDIDWEAMGKSVSVRVNGFDSEWLYRDIVDLVEKAGERLHMIMLPKVSRPEEVIAVDLWLTQIERAKKIERPIGLELLVESAQGIANVEAIAAASTRTESLVFGVGDFAASTGMRTTNIGGLSRQYSVEGRIADIWHYTLARLVVAARAAGKRPVDGPYADFNDPIGMKESAARAAALGCEGKMVIHPSQIADVNEAFTPDPGEVERARAILLAMEEAAQRGQGAAAFEGRLIDIASIRQAEALVAKAGRIRGGH